MPSLARMLILLCAAFALSSAPARADAPVLNMESWIEQWDPRSQSWVRLDDMAADGADRFLVTPRVPRRKAIARYGPFYVINGQRAALIGVTDAVSPTWFSAMLRDFPDLQTLSMVECPGTDDDRGNLAVGRLIRAAGLQTLVPADGSVRSGAVELFLAGASRRIEDGAEFAVHSWLDSSGREADDYAADAAANRTYLDYYREMGMSEAQAQAFYAMTNSVPHAEARWLDAQEMRAWLQMQPDTGAIPPPIAPRIAPRIAFANVDLPLPLP